MSKIWEVLAKMVHYGKKAFKKVHSQAQRRSKKTIKKKISENFYMVSHVREMRRLRKLKRRIKRSHVIELISQKE